MSIPYSKSFRECHRRLGAGLPIDLWCNVIGKELPEFSDPRDIYESMTLRVKAYGDISDPRGTIPIQITCTDPRWYGKACEGIAKMLDIKSAANITLKNMVGKDIRDFTHQDLDRTGEVDVYVGNRVYRHENVPVVPKEFSTNKIDEIAGWYSEVRNTIVDNVSAELEGKSLAQISTMMKSGGPVFQMIKKCVKSCATPHYTWPEFVRVYGIDMEKRTNVKEAERVADAVSNTMLHYIREGLAASQHEISNFIALTHTGEQPLFTHKPGAAAAAVASKYEDAHELFYTIVSEALSAPALSQNVVFSIYRRNRVEKVAIASNSKSNIKSNIKSNSSAHPWGNHLKYRFLPHYGYMPVAHIHNGLDEKSPYRGNVGRTIDAFNVFSGGVPFPKTVACGSCDKRKKKKKGKKGKNYVRGELPPLIPLERDTEKETFSDMASLVERETLPVLVEAGSMPPLVPYKKSGPRLKPYVPGVTNLSKPVFKSQNRLPTLSDFL